MSGVIFDQKRLVRHIVTVFLQAWTISLHWLMACEALLECMSSYVFWKDNAD